jgi:hypothetical protein
MILFFIGDISTTLRFARNDDWMLLLLCDCLVASDSDEFVDIVY